ncbi:MAG: chemotaxis protein CheW [Prolixibacteraceae bacterium]|nr:chemotaxis protein CheW [Prolixibacteraceae bacterium]
MDDNLKTKENFILFELNNTTYAVKSLLVKQMEMIDEITPVPNAPEYIDGIVFSRGQVIPVLNLRKRFGFEISVYNLSTRLIVVQHQERSVGLVVDSSREFISLDTSTIQPPPEYISGLSGKYLEGIATIDKRILLILDLESILKMSDTTINN